MQNSYLSNSLYAELDGDGHMSYEEIEIGKEIFEQCSEAEKRDIIEVSKDDAIKILFMFLDKIERYLQYRVREDLLGKGIRVNYIANREVVSTDIEKEGVKVKWVVEISILPETLKDIVALEAYLRKAIRNVKLVAKYKHGLPTTEVDEHVLGIS